MSERGRAIKYLELRKIAIHEAGHAVACVVLGIPFHSVTIVPTAEAQGRVVTKELRVTRDTVEMGEDGAYAALPVGPFIKKFVQVCYAGHWAENMYLPQGETLQRFEERKASSGDWQRISEVVDRYRVDPSTGCLGELSKQAQLLTGKHRSKIDLVAYFLTGHKTLTRKEVVDLCRRVPVEG